MLSFIMLLMILRAEGTWAVQGHTVRQWGGHGCTLPPYYKGLKGSFSIIS